MAGHVLGITSEEKKKKKFRPSGRHSITRDGKGTIPVRSSASFTMRWRMCATKYEWAPNAGTEVLIPVKVSTSFKANEWTKNWSELISLTRTYRVVRLM